MSASIEAWLPGSVGIFLQGAAGDIHPFDWWFGNWKSKHMHTHEDTEVFGRALAAEAIRASEGAAMRRTAQVRAAQRSIGLPRRKVNWTLEQAERQQERLKKRLGSYQGETWPEGTTTAIAAMKLPMLYGSGANEVRLAKNQTEPAVVASVQSVRLGDVTISASPGELFNELGLEIKRRSEPGSWVASYSDGYVGYISTRRPHEEIFGVQLAEIVDQERFRKYYGTTTSPFAPEAGEILVDAAVDLMKSV